jgi:hypothetical protein
MKKSENTLDNYREKIAKDFFAVFLSNQMGITFKTAQNYVGNEIGELSLFLADLAIKSVNEQLDDSFGEVVSKSNPQKDFEN